MPQKLVGGDAENMRKPHNRLKRRQLPAVLKIGNHRRAFADFLGKLELCKPRNPAVIFKFSRDYIHNAHALNPIITGNFHQFKTKDDKK